jgi:hypothetical protein
VGGVRIVTYRPIPGVGGGTLPAEDARLDEFLAHHVPYLLEGGAAPKPWMVPPLVVLNTTFGSGLRHAGMSGGAEWEPFEIDEREYLELVEALRERGYEPSPTDVPVWVTTQRDWQIWADELKLGIPADEQRRLRDAADEAERAWKESWDEAERTRDPTLPAIRFADCVNALRLITDLRAGAPPGTARQTRNTAAARLGWGASAASMTLRAAERIGDPGLVEKWRAISEQAHRELEASGVDPTVAKVMAIAVDWADHGAEQT